jgi:hypothetical protein
MADSSSVVLEPTRLREKIRVIFFNENTDSGYALLGGVNIDDLVVGIGISGIRYKTLPIDRSNCFA